jgi:predicted esterase
VAPAAAGSAWSLEAADVRFVDAALRRAFARCRVRPDRVLIGGFSSGAGMALWLGLTNGDLFHAILALSPGGSLPGASKGRPDVYLAHGTRDRVIPVTVGGDVVAERLRGAGLRVRYVRFPGGHRPIPSIVRSLVNQARR